MLKPSRLLAQWVLVVRANRVYIQVLEPATAVPTMASSIEKPHNSGSRISTECPTAAFRQCPLMAANVSRRRRPIAASGQARLPGRALAKTDDAPKQRFRGPNKRQLPGSQLDWTSVRGHLRVLTTGGSRATRRSLQWQRTSSSDRCTPALGRKAARVARRDPDVEQVPKGAQQAIGASRLEAG